MTEGARLVAIHGKFFVIQHRFAEQFNLLHLIVRRIGEPLKGLRFDTIDLSLNLGDFPESRVR